MKPFYTAFRLQGSDILVRGYGADGHRTSMKLPIQPTFWVESDNTYSGQFSPAGKNLVPVKFNNVFDARQWKKDHDGPAFGETRFEYEAIDELYPGPYGIEFDFSLIRTLFIDIECTSEQGFPSPINPVETVNVVTISMNGQRWTYATGQLNREPKLAPNTTFVYCVDEYTLFTNLIKRIRALDPDVITGWNCEGFDIPYLIARGSRVVGKSINKLSPHNIITTRRAKDRFNNQIEVPEIAGVAILDYIALYPRYTLKNYDSYKLDDVAERELGAGRGKLKSEYKTFKEHYTKDFAHFIEYNEQDVIIVEDLDIKFRFIHLACTIAYRCKVNFTDVYGQVRMWEQLVAIFLRSKNVQPPIKQRGSSFTDREELVGAYVKDPKAGKYGWTMSFDVTSLYPSVMMMFNISPETLVRDKKIPKNLVADILAGKFKAESGTPMCVAANGAHFTTERPGVIPQIMEQLFNERKAYKKEMLKAETLAARIEKQLEKFK